MSKIVKRKKKRKIVKRFSQSFEVHENGFLYRQIGRMYVFPEFPTKDCLYFTVRAEAGFFYSKRCRHGKTIRIPPWLIEGFKRRGMKQELEAIEQIRRYVKERGDGSPKASPRKTPTKVRIIRRRSPQARHNAESLQESQKQSENEAKLGSDERHHHTL